MLFPEAALLKKQHPSYRDTVWLGLARRTASGERFSAAAFTAANRHWPLGCLVRCTNLHNGQWVVVRVNDRGPYVRDRHIDLTPKAGHVIGLTRTQGICRVRIERFH